MSAYDICTSIERDGDSAFIPYFKDYLKNKGYFLTKHDTKEMQALGDYTIHNEHASIYIDRKHETNTSPNMFFEIYSNRHTSNFGWGISLPSDYVVYSFGGHQVYCFIDLIKLRKLINIDENFKTVFKNGLEFYGKYRVINQTKYKQGNLTQGLLIPFKDISTCIYKTLIVENDEMVECSFDKFLAIAKRVNK